HPGLGVPEVEFPPGRRPIRYLGRWGNRPFGVQATQGFESSYQVDNSWRRAEELMTCRSSRLRSDVSPCENLLEHVWNFFSSRQALRASPLPLASRRASAPR